MIPSYFENLYIYIYLYIYSLLTTKTLCGYSIDIKKVDKQLTHAMHVKDRHVNDTFIDKLTKWYQ